MSREGLDEKSEGWVPAGVTQLLKTNKSSPGWNGFSIKKRGALHSDELSLRLSSDVPPQSQTRRPPRGGNSLMLLFLTSSHSLRELIEMTFKIVFLIVLFIKVF